MKRLLTILLLLAMLLNCFSACKKRRTKSKDDAETNSSSFADSIPEDWDSSLGESFNEYRMMEYLTELSEQSPLIMYNIKGDIAKDSEVSGIYVLRGGKCRKYTHRSITLGELSKMTDEEILDMLDENYRENIDKAMDIWCDYEFTYYDEDDQFNYFSLRNEFDSGVAKVYYPGYYDVTTILLTDDSGNSVEQEVLVFPVSGVGRTPFVMYYPESGNSIHSMNYYTTVADEDSPGTVKFYQSFFNTGYGTKEDLNKVTDCFCISENSSVAGTVYKSTYFGFETVASDFTEKRGKLIFRHDYAYVLSIQFDDLYSECVQYVDPEETNLESIMGRYRNAYYSSFVTQEALYNELRK